MRCIRSRWLPHLANVMVRQSTHYEGYVSVLCIYDECLLLSNLKSKVSDLGEEVCTFVLGCVYQQAFNFGRSVKSKR